jgi:hypothetical protein
MQDVSLILSLKADTEDRLRNLRLVADCYARMAVGAEVIVVEQGAVPAAAGLPGVRHVFLGDDGCHWKTRNLNMGALLSARPLLVFTDCDALPHPEALAHGLARLRGGADAVHLFDGVMANVPAHRAETATTWDAFFAGLRHFPPDRIDPLRSQDDPEEFPLYGNASYLADGGCIAVTREAFAACGGWNPNFVSYGFEDQEFDLRLRRLGLRVERTEGFNLVHLDHPRGRDSRFATFDRQNEAEYDRVAAMAPDDLRLYAMRGFRAVAFRHDGDYVRDASPDADGWQRVAPRRVDLADVVIVVLADARRVAYDRSCLEPFLDYLEGRFRDYDLRLCECRATRFKHIVNKSNVTYHWMADDPREAEIDGIVRTSGRSLVHVLRLSRDAEGQFARLTSTFDRLLDGASPSDLFAPATLPGARLRA